MKKRILALLVSAVMLIGLFPGEALAAEGDVVMVTRSETDRSDPMYFTSLSDAMVYSVASDTGYIKLLKDTTSGVFIDVGKTAPSGVVFDLGGHTLTLSPSGGSVGTTTNGFRVLYGNEATVKNGTVVAEFNKDTNRVKVAFANYGTLTLDGVTVNHSGDLTGDTGSMVAYTINNGGRLDVIGSTITNTVTGATDTNLVLAFGDYRSGNLSNTGVATIDGDSVLNGDIGVYGVSDESSLTIDGTVGGTIVDKSGETDEDTVKLNGTLATADIASAVKYAAEGAVITLTEDLTDIGSIVLPAGVTIDGSGKTISGNSCFKVSTSGTTVIRNVNFKDIKDPADGAKLSAIYATGLAADADVTITGCSFDNMEWEAVQVTSSVDGAAVAITDNEFRHTDPTTTSERHIHVQPGSAGCAMNLTITGNKLYDCDRVKAAIGVYYITGGGSVDMAGNYVSAVSGTDAGVSTIAVMLKGDEGYYNASELALPFMDETLTNEISYSFLAHGTGNNSWKGSFHTTFADAVAAATTDDVDEIIDTIDLLADITVSDAIDLRTDGATFNQNGKSITLTGNGSIASPTELVVTADEGYDLVTDTTDGYAYSVGLKQFTVTFVSDGETVASAVVGYGETVTAPADPSRDGYIFAGWYDGDTAYDFSTPVTGDITLTAGWTADTQSDPDEGEDPAPSDPPPTEPSDPPPQQPGGNTGNTGNAGNVGGSTGSAAGDKTTTEVVENEDGSISVTIPEGTETVTLPVEALTAPTDSAEARSIDIDLPEGESVKIEIPVSEPSAGVVVVIVREDGTEEVVTGSIPTEDGVAFTASGDVTIKIIDRSSDFDDVAADAWYADAVDFAVARGILHPDGTGGNKFEPQLNTTRAMMFTMLARLAGVDTEGGETWYEKGMAWAVESGISDGTNPEENITREQLVTMLYRCAQLCEPDVSIGENTNILGYEDASGVSEWAAAAMEWAVEVGIINGYPDGTLRPGNFATRAEIAVVMQRFVEFMSK